MISLILAIVSSCLVAVNLIFVGVNLNSAGCKKKKMVFIGILIATLCLFSAIINFNANKVI